MPSYPQGLLRNQHKPHTDMLIGNNPIMVINMDSWDSFKAGNITLAQAMAGSYISSGAGSVPGGVLIDPYIKFAHGKAKIFSSGVNFDEFQTLNNGSYTISTDSDTLTELEDTALIEVVFTKLSGLDISTGKAAPSINLSNIVTYDTFKTSTKELVVSPMTNVVKLVMEKKKENNEVAVTKEDLEEARTTTAVAFDFNVADLDVNFVKETNIKLLTVANSLEMTATSLVSGVSALTGIESNIAPTTEDVYKVIADKILEKEDSTSAVLDFSKSEEVESIISQVITKVVEDVPEAIKTTVTASLTKLKTNQATVISQSVDSMQSIAESTTGTVTVTTMNEVLATRLSAEKQVNSGISGEIFTNDEWGTSVITTMMEEVTTISTETLNTDWMTTELSNTTPPDQPTIDSVTSNAGYEATISWSAPSSDGGTDITGYILNYASVAQTPASIAPVITSTQVDVDKATIFWSFDSTQNTGNTNILEYCINRKADAVSVYCFFHDAMYAPYLISGSFDDYSDPIELTDATTVNAVSVYNETNGTNEGKYTFNGKTSYHKNDSYKIKKLLTPNATKQYTLHVPESHPIAILNRGIENVIGYTGVTSAGKKTVTNTTNDGEYEFYWGEVMMTVTGDANGNVDLSHYASNTGIYTGGNTILSGELTDLPMAVKYHFNVSTVTDLGVGISGETAISYLAATTPGQPQNFNASYNPADGTGAILSWNEPWDGGHPITSYIYEHSDGTVNTTGTVAEGETANLTGLTPGKAYTFSVKAVNGEGIGSASAQSSATPGRAPVQPAQPTISGEVTVTTVYKNNNVYKIWSIDGNDPPYVLEAGGSSLENPNTLRGTGDPNDDSDGIITDYNSSYWNTNTNREKAFDGNLTDKMRIDGFQSGPYNPWIKFKFPTSKIITKYSIWIGEDDAYPAEFALEGSTDDSHWITLDSQIKQDNVIDQKMSFGGYPYYNLDRYLTDDIPGSKVMQKKSLTYSFSNTQGFTYYRIVFMSTRRRGRNENDWRTHIGQIALYSGGPSNKYFTVPGTSPVNLDIFMIGGGGSGGRSVKGGGGGGSGSAVEALNWPIEPGTYTLEGGNGGEVPTNASSRGTSGKDTTFGNLFTAKGGSGGAILNNSNEHILIAGAGGFKGTDDNRDTFSSGAVETGNKSLRSGPYNSDGHEAFNGTIINKDDCWKGHAEGSNNVSERYVQYIDFRLPNTPTKITRYDIWIRSSGETTDVHFPVDWVLTACPILYPNFWHMDLFGIPIDTQTNITGWVQPSEGSGSILDRDKKTFYVKNPDYYDNYRLTITKAYKNLNDPSGVTTVNISQIAYYSDNELIGVADGGCGGGLSNMPSHSSVGINNSSKIFKTDNLKQNDNNTVDNDTIGALREIRGKKFYLALDEATTFNGFVTNKGSIESDHIELTNDSEPETRGYYICRNIYPGNRCIIKFKLDLSTDDTNDSNYQGGTFAVMLTTKKINWQHWGEDRIRYPWEDTFKYDFFTTMINRTDSAYYGVGVAQSNVKEDKCDFDRSNGEGSSWYEHYQRDKGTFLNVGWQEWTLEYGKNGQDGQFVNVWNTHDIENVEPEFKFIELENKKLSECTTVAFVSTNVYSNSDHRYSTCKLKDIKIWVSSDDSSAYMFNNASTLELNSSSKFYNDDSARYNQGTDSYVKIAGYNGGTSANSANDFSAGGGGIDGSGGNSTASSSGTGGDGKKVFQDLGEDVLTKTYGKGGDGFPKPSGDPQDGEISTGSGGDGCKKISLTEEQINGSYYYKVIDEGVSGFTGITQGGTKEISDIIINNTSESFLQLAKHNLYEERYSNIRYNVYPGNRFIANFETYFSQTGDKRSGLYFIWGGTRDLGNLLHDDSSNYRGYKLVFRQRDIPNRIWLGYGVENRYEYQSDSSRMVEVDTNIFQDKQEWTIELKDATLKLWRGDSIDISTATPILTFNDVSIPLNSNSYVAWGAHSTNWGGGNQIAVRNMKLWVSTDDPSINNLDPPLNPGSGGSGTIIIRQSLGAPGVPTPPTDILCNYATSEQTSITWNTPHWDGNFAITGYEVQQAVSPSYITWNSLGTTTLGSFVVTGLSVTSSYKFRVKAINSEGSSESIETGVITVDSSPFTAGDYTRDYTDEDGITYRVHDFTTEGTSTITTLNDMTVDFLIVAGGGGGGSNTPNYTGWHGPKNYYSGGGGAGGVVVGKQVKLGAGAYNVTVGKGGGIVTIDGNNDKIVFSYEVSAWGSTTWQNHTITITHGDTTFTELNEYIANHMLPDVVFRLTYRATIEILNNRTRTIILTGSTSTLRKYFTNSTNNQTINSQTSWAQDISSTTYGTSSGKKGVNSSIVGVDGHIDFTSLGGGGGGHPYHPVWSALSGDDEKRHNRRGQYYASLIENDTYIPKTRAHHNLDGGSGGGAACEQQQSGHGGVHKRPGISLGLKDATSTFKIESGLGDKYYKNDPINYPNIKVYGNNGMQGNGSGGGGGGAGEMCNYNSLEPNSGGNGIKNTFRYGPQSRRWITINSYNQNIKIENTNYEITQGQYTQQELVDHLQSIFDTDANGLKIVTKDENLVTIYNPTNTTRYFKTTDKSIYEFLNIKLANFGYDISIDANTDHNTGKHYMLLYDSINPPDAAKAPYNEHYGGGGAGGWLDNSTYSEGNSSTLFNWSWMDNNTGFVPYRNEINVTRRFREFYNRNLGGIGGGGGGAVYRKLDSNRGSKAVALEGFPNTGGGGGGGSQSIIGAKGGSGIVVIRYPIASSPPLQPTGLVSRNDNNSVHLEWTEPSNNGGHPIILGNYKIEKKESSNTTWQVISQTGHTAVTGLVDNIYHTKVTGLSNGTTYNFRVSAANQIGTGVTSSISGTPSNFSSTVVASNGQKTTDGSYELYTFTSSGSLELPSNRDVEFLIVAGGGGGAGNFGGGGGGGGVLVGTQYTLIGGTTYNIIVGQGGAGGTAEGTDGEDSSIIGATGTGFLKAKGGCKGGMGTGGNWGGVSGNQANTSIPIYAYRYGIDTNSNISPVVINSGSYNSTSITAYGNWSPDVFRNDRSGGGAGAGDRGAIIGNSQDIMPHGGNGIQISWTTPKSLGVTDWDRGIAGDPYSVRDNGFYWGGGGGGAGVSEQDQLPRGSGNGGLGGGGCGGLVERNDNYCGAFGEAGGGGYNIGLPRRTGYRKSATSSVLEDSGDGGVNTGGGGGGGKTGGTGGTGGSGIVIIRYIP